MSSYLPEDIIADILSRLPAKSIQRFRCVCKSWVKLLSNPDFIKIHLKYAKERNTTNLLIRGDDNFIYVSRDIDSSSSSITCSKANEIDINSLSTKTCLGSCNGLVCLDADNAFICFWNPTTNEYKRVSKPESCYSSKIDGDPWGFLCGLGYDSNNDDYKFVMISNPRGDDGVSASSEVNLYSLRSNSWKIIECNVCYYLGTPQCVGVFLNGVLHWGRTHMSSTETGFAIRHSILSFNVRNETFNLELRQPKELDRYYFPKFGICMLGDRLCMFLEMILGGENCLDVWVMKEYGVRESWSNLCTVVTNKLLGVEDESPVIPIHILKNGEFLLEKDGDQKTIVLYDPVHSSARVLEINGVPNWLGTETFLESLVSPKLGNQTGSEEELQEQ